MVERGPGVAVLKTDGINCDRETAHAFRAAGGKVEVVQLTDLLSRDKRLEDYHILAIPGGFSYGDDIGSGVVLAAELRTQLADQLEHFANDQERLVIGICNGAQVLVKTGLVPSGELGTRTATLTTNESGRFECREVDLLVESSVCVFTGQMEREVRLPAAHAEGRFVTDAAAMQELHEGQQVVFRYIDDQGYPTTSYPANPNGSAEGIAGVCDASGRILAMMPHPERAVADHPRKPAHGRPLFAQMIDYTKKS